MTYENTVVESSFAQVLRRRIDDYFVEHNLSPKADARMKTKIVLGLSAWAASFVALYAIELNSWSLLLVFLAIGVAEIFLLLNVAHDSVHNAVSKKGSVNAFLSYIYDGCGVSSYLVRILHNHGHHSCINLLGEDDPLAGRRVFRFTRLAPKKIFHRFQHLYAPIFYGLFSIDYIFLRDFEDFFFPNQPCLTQTKHSLREYVILFAGKSVYLTATIALPIWYLGYSPVLVILGFVLMQFAVGLTVAAVFAPTHILHGNDFPERRDVYEDYVHHIFATTHDFATESSLVSWLTGGLNHHIVHHICPYVCHTHYPQLTKIVKRTAMEFQIPYKEKPTMLAALGDHLSFLKLLGNE